LLVELPVRLFRTVEIVVRKPVMPPFAGLTVMRAKPRGAAAFMLALAALVASWFLNHAVEAQEAANNEFRRGMGISHVMAWAPVESAPSKGFVYPPFSYPNAAFTSELRELRRLGFDFVRFAVDPGPFLQWQGSRRDYLDRMLIDRVRQILSCNLSVIV